MAALHLSTLSIMKTIVSVDLSDGDLITEVGRLARGEREATACLIAHLAELYGRRLHERAGFSSLFTYCVAVLRLSEHEAYDRMKAAKVARRYPLAVRLLAGARVNLTTIRLLAPHLTPRNHEELFEAACGRSKREVQELVARRFPRADVASSVRKLPARRAVGVAPLAVAPPASSFSPADADQGGVDAASAPRPYASEVTVRAIGPAPPPPLVQPLAPDRYHVSFTATAETREKLELAQDLLRHAVPSGDPAAIFARALDVLVEDLVRKKYAATDRPQASRRQADDSRHIPAEVKRAVFVRDRGRCVFFGSGGRKCGERAFVEFHHLTPYAAGGKPTIDNIELRCRVHNGYEAHLFFGPAREYLATTRHDARDITAPHDTTVLRDVSPATHFRSGTKTASGNGRAPTSAPHGAGAPRP